MLVRLFFISFQKAVFVIEGCKIMLKPYCKNKLKGKETISTIKEKLLYFYHYANIKTNIIKS